MAVVTRCIYIYHIIFNIISIRKMARCRFLINLKSGKVYLFLPHFFLNFRLIKAASSKVAKYEKMCSDNQHAFIPFAFDTFDFLAPEVVDLLRRVQMVMHNNVMSPRSMNIVFTRIDFAIQKRPNDATCCPLTFYLCVSNP